MTFVFSVAKDPPRVETTARARHGQGRRLGFRHGQRLYLDTVVETNATDLGKREYRRLGCEDCFHQMEGKKKNLRQSSDVQIQMLMVLINKLESLAYMIWIVPFIDTIPTLEER
ncbi:hypothetical protein R6Q59_035029 [Mikania micrantha]